ncbi:MAG: proline--tRNA ligase, partial [Candidatus Omnitrophica bacterium]|nr:proline--tRNA ligase [Candidatus Omnitrophota bacterium]
GKESAEFMVISESGEDMIAHCGACGYAASLEAGAGSCSCSKCGKEAEIKRAMEVGHIFKLGTRYTEELKVNFLDKDGKEKPIIMGCYGIGVNRLLAAIIELNHDDKGIIWPNASAPFKVLIMPLEKSSQADEVAGKIYNELTEAGIEVLVDDRDLQAGVKFKDADLIGIPVQVVIGARGLREGKIEIKRRLSGEKELIDINKATAVFFAGIL